MQTADVTETLDLARATTGVDRIRVVHRPRLLSDNGPGYVSAERAADLERHGLGHTRGAPYHPMTQGNIERYHRSMKNVVKLEKSYSPWALERAIARFVDAYNHHRLHEALDNVTQADVYEGWRPAILARPDQIKRRTLAQRTRENLHGHRPHHRLDESGQNEIYVKPFPNVDDGKWQVSTDGGGDPVWSTDGRQLFFVELPPRLMIAEIETDPTFSRGTPTEVVNLGGFDRGGGGRRYDLAPDGERFVVRRSGGAQTIGEDASDRLIFVENWFQELTERVPTQ